jgi:rhodanese-related sulfurtransferase
MDTAQLSSELSIQPSELVQRMQRQNPPLLLDVRRASAFDASPIMLAGAQRCLPEQIAEFAQRETPREVVVYCVYGHGVSQTAAQELRALGWPARYLAGGFRGGEEGVDAAELIAHWRSVPPLTFRKRPDLGVNGVAPSLWITRERPKIDRIACPWLIRRFIDPLAQILYVPAAEVLQQAQALSATAFDIPDGAISHVEGYCSFDAFLAAFDLHTPALDLMARLVRGADTALLDLEPPCAGLLAITQGMARLHADNDLALLHAMLPVYDALYQWSVDCVQGQLEAHAWRAPVPDNDAQLRRRAEQARKTLR